MKTKLKRKRNFNMIKRFLREGFSFKRSIIFSLILAFQFFGLIYLYIQFASTAAWVYFTSVLLSIVTCFRVMIATKNPDAKASWILFVLLFPTFGYLIYFLSGGSDMHPLHKKRLNAIDHEAKPFILQNNIEMLDDKTKEDATFLYETSQSIAYQNSKTTYFKSGETIFQDIILELSKAQKSIFIEFFIIHQGDLFDHIFQILKEKRSEGVDVRIIYDGFGSQDFMTRKLKKTFREYGIKAYSFSPIKPIFSFFLNYRDHRKMLIIDDKVAYIGGMNLADEYVNHLERFGYWKDSGLKVEGSAVESMTITFLKMWRYVTNQAVDFKAYQHDLYHHLDNRDDTVIPFATGPNQALSVSRALYTKMINQATNSIWIMTPYLIIDDALLDMLENKALGGVDVRIVIPGIPDKKVVYALTKAISEKLMKSKVKVYTFKPGFIHSKVMLIDQRVAVVGSVNMDFRSFYQQYENAVYLNQENTVASVGVDFLETFAKSEMQDMTSLKTRGFIYKAKIAFLKWVAPLM